MIEVLAKGDIRQIAEVGYVFQERKKGGSKASFRIFIEYLFHLIRLRFSLWPILRFIKFCLVGGSGAVYTLTLSGGDLAGLNGTVSLDLAVGQDIEDLAGNTLPAGEPATDEDYVVDNTAPTLLAFTRQNPPVSPTSVAAPPHESTLAATLQAPPGRVTAQS